MASCPACCNCNGVKAVVWTFWSLLTFVGVIYSGLALVSFSAVKSGTNHFEMSSDTQKSTYRNSLLASCVIGFLLVLFFMVYSFLVLIWRSFGDPKLAYGIMLGTSMHTCWFLILAGLVLQNRESDMEALVSVGYWSNRDLKTYQATYIFSYILSALYILAFVILLFGRAHLGSKDKEGPTASGPPQPVNMYMGTDSLSATKQVPMTRNNQV